MLPPKAVNKSNWVQTVPDKGWFTAIRVYSPKKAIFDGSWKLLGDIAPGSVVDGELSPLRRMPEAKRERGPAWALTLGLGRDPRQMTGCVCTMFANEDGCRRIATDQDGAKRSGAENRTQRINSVCSSKTVNRHGYAVDGCCGFDSRAFPLPGLKSLVFVRG